MHVPSIQDILLRVTQPSRYLGTEPNRCRKPLSQVQLKIALAFPDLYEIGTSHFGLQILYHILNNREGIAAEQVFAPGQDMEAELRRNQKPLFTLESHRPLAEFDIIGFSLLYELNYTNVLNMLDLSGLALRAAERRSGDPLVIAGGPCVCNPEPMADFFDAMVFGDGEEVILRMAEVWLELRAGGNFSKAVLLRQWSRLPGIYVPGFYTPSYDASGFQHLHPQDDAVPARISRAILADLDGAEFPDRPVVAFGRPVHDRLRLEISRGCSRACRFCQAGMIYRPVRERSPQRLVALAEKSLATTGYEDLSLLSLSTGDYTCLAPLMERLMTYCSRERVALSLPSIRAGTLTPQLMQLIRQVRKTGFTIAPEAGSQRLRDVINKNITAEDVFDTVRDAFSLGWRVIKLYFMIGLPTETEVDMAAIVELVRQLQQVKDMRRRNTLNVSVTTFIPKPHTPFQWAAQCDLAGSRAKIDYLKSRLDRPGMHVKWQHPEMSLLEGVMARGDRRLSRVIEQAYRNGCTFDGWTDRFDFARWLQAFERGGVDPAFFTTRSRDPEEPLPWAHMDAGVTPEFLKTQWQAAHEGVTVEDCRHGECHGCGVCDFDTIRPRVFRDYAPLMEAQPAGPEPVFVRWELIYSKLGPARLFGHLEMAHIFARALRRAGVAVQYSQGFHPMPRISFDDPLPVGMEGEAERMRILVQAAQAGPDLTTRINAHLPAGLHIVAAHRASGTSWNTAAVPQYRIERQAGFDAQRLREFQACEQWPHTRDARRGGHCIDLKQCIQELRLEGRALYLSVRPLDGRTVRPVEILIALFGLDDEALQAVRICKLAPPGTLAAS
jgi:radical SAM family uncharacterized protein/radical SAM-linked protein